jgi:hypothetical protein
MVISTGSDQRRNLSESVVLPVTPISSSPADEQDVPNPKAVVPRGKKARTTARPHQQHASPISTDELERKCRHLQDLCGYWERSAQIIAKDAKWEHSAPYVPRGYWINRGFDVQGVVRMEGFLEKLNRKTCKMRSDVFVKSNEGKRIVLTSNNAATPLPHDDKALSHWEEYGNALQLYLHPEASHWVSFGNVQLHPSVIDLLTPALMYKSIRRFGLRHNGFVSSSGGCRFAINIIRSNRWMVEFAWVDNPIDSIDDAVDLVETIISHPLLDNVSLTNCFGGGIDAYHILCSLLSSGKGFTRIDLESNSIRTGGGTETSAYLATNPPLTHLFLENNCLDDIDAGLIARALKRNTNLRRLCLGRNKITAPGIEALRDAIFDHASLNAVADSNHSCQIRGLDVDHLNNHDDSNLNRAEKLYRLLSSRHREGINVPHLDAEFCGDSLKLVPNALGCVHRYAMHRAPSRTHPLSIMYEITRSWKMPTLYENIGTARGMGDCR